MTEPWPGLGVGRQLLALDLALGDRARLTSTSLTSAAESDWPTGSPWASARVDLKRERLAVEVDVARRAQADAEPPDRQHDRRRGGHVVLRQLGGQLERLLLGEALGGKLELELARPASVVPWRMRPSGRLTSIGRPATGAPYWYFATSVGLDRLAAVEDRLLQVEGQVDRLELVRVDLELPEKSLLPGWKTRTR